MASNDAATQAGFAEFAESRSASLLRLAYILTGQREAAEDLVQDTLVDVFRHWRRVLSADHRDAYVRRMLMNRYLDAEKRRRRWVERPLSDEQATSNDVTSAAIEVHDIIWRAFGELSPRQQAALVLRYYEDLDDQQIGAIMRCRPSTVRSLVSRALAALRASPHLQIREIAESRSEDQ